MAIRLFVNKSDMVGYIVSRSLNKGCYHIITVNEDFNDIDPPGFKLSLLVIQKEEQMARSLAHIKVLAYLFSHNIWNKLDEEILIITDYHHASLANAVALCLLPYSNNLEYSRQISYLPTNLTLDTAKMLINRVDEECAGIIGKGNLVKLFNQINTDGSLG